MSNSNQNINPKSCVYNCNTQIYWNSSVNEYWEVFTNKKHIVQIDLATMQNQQILQQQQLILNQPINNKKPWSSIQQSKPKMSNSFELLQGSIEEIQKKYEILSDMVSEYNGKVHGSQRDRDPKTGLIDLLVYYEVPLGHRDKVKRKFDNFYYKSDSEMSHFGFSSQ